MAAALDDAGLVCIAAAAADVDAVAVCDGTDVAELVRVVSAIEAAETPVAAAAAALVQIARRRPFPVSNTAAAWLAAAHVLANEHLVVRPGELDVHQLISRIRTGHVDEQEVAQTLTEHVRVRPGRLVGWLRRLFLPAAQAPATWPCPLCDRPVSVRGGDIAWLKGPTAPEARAVLIALCRRTHGTHRPPERRRPAPASHPVYIAAGRRRRTAEALVPAG